LRFLDTGDSASTALGVNGPSTRLRFSALRVRGELEVTGGSSAARCRLRGFLSLVTEVNFGLGESPGLVVVPFRVDFAWGDLTAGAGVLGPATSDRRRTLRRNGGTAVGGVPILWRISISGTGASVIRHTTRNRLR
jgi:hypothetical protein